MAFNKPALCKHQTSLKWDLNCRQTRTDQPISRCHRHAELRRGRENQQEGVAAAPSFMDHELTTQPVRMFSCAQDLHPHPHPPIHFALNTFNQYGWVVHDDTSQE